jgi:hypothetical protein
MLANTDIPLLGPFPSFDLNSSSAILNYVGSYTT